MIVKKEKVAAVVLASSFLVSGCALFNNEVSLTGDDRVTLASANQLMGRTFEDITDETLLSILDPNKYHLSKTIKASVAGEVNGAGKITCTREGTGGKQTYSEKISKAYKAANSCYSGKAHRNQIQDTFIAASIQRCNFYQTYLKDVSIHQNGMLGIGTTFLGGAGAIVTGENAARVLSGLAGITSGIRAEANQAIFETVATTIIVPGIIKQREAIMSDIETKRSKGIAEYTVQAAIADALRFHRDCRIDAGIAYADKSIQKYDDIGIKTLTNTLNDVGLARSFSNALFGGTPAPKSYLIALQELDKTKQPLIEMQESISEAKKVPFSDLDNLITKYEDGGDYHSKAKTFDQSLKDFVFDFYQTKGYVKESKLNKIHNEQNEVIKFIEGLEKENKRMQEKVKLHLNPPK